MPPPPPPQKSSGFVPLDESALFCEIWVKEEMGEVRTFTQDPGSNVLLKKSQS